MNIYSLFPLIATIAYIPLLITTISSRPWHKRQKLFFVFLIAAMTWSLTDIFFRGNFFPQHSLLLLKIIVIIFTWMVVQLHHFSSSFYFPNQQRLLGFAYFSLALVIVLVVLGYTPEKVTVIDNKIYSEYGIGVIIVALPMLVLFGRNLSVLGKNLRVLYNPVLYNQVFSLLVGILILAGFTAGTFIPGMEPYPISHFSNIVVAFILSYATIRHQLIDIKFVLWRGLGWFSWGLIGSASYIVIFIILTSILNINISIDHIFIATVTALFMAYVVFRLQKYLFIAMGRAISGRSYDYRQRLFDFSDKIHNVFSLTEQGGELLTLVTKAIGCNKASLLFFDKDSSSYTAQLVEPDERDNPLLKLYIREDSPVIEYLRQKQMPLTREYLSILPEFRSLWEQEKKEIEDSEIELFMPLISRSNLIGILVLDKKQSSRYSLEDLNLLENVTERVAVSMEKEYLREQLKEREEELSIINRSSAIITSSLDIQGIYESFIHELNNVADVGWAAITLAEENGLYFLALSSKIGSAWKAGERIPIKGTGTEWVINQNRHMVEPNLSIRSRFTTDKYHLQHGVRSIAYLPLTVKDKAIGSLIVASRKPDAYSQRQVNLLQQLASQISMPIENSRLYAEAEQKARIDGLTGLLNRRSMDEMIDSEIGRHSRYGGVFSLIILDLDGFKAFNDRYGHLAGDKLLRRMGNIMKSATRSADQAFRYGGDEFAVLLPQTYLDAASQVAERIRKKIAGEVKPDKTPVTTSIGLASWPADGVVANEVIAAADAALYHAKRTGGNMIHCASGTLLEPDTVTYSADTQSSEALSAIYRLAASIDARDHYTGNHLEIVSQYAVALAEALGLETLEVSRVKTCALLHDIGKSGIGDEILNKVGKLNDDEWRTIKIHPELGAAIVRHTSHLAHCVPGILYHHERYDGSGYPHGLKGEQIPLEARILAVADAYAAMTTIRPFSDALNYEESIMEIKNGAGTQFDPNLVEVFLKSLNQ